MIRCDGETISPNKTYSGKRVLELLDVSYKNGYNRGVQDQLNKAIDDANIAYQKGFNNGRDAAAPKLARLRELLLDILQDDAP